MEVESVKNTIEGGLITNGLNAKDVICERCRSVILKTNTATLVKKQMQLPVMKKKNADDPDSAIEDVEDCWLVGQMFAFENIGFSKQVDNIKYLVCADCETGPVGWHDVGCANEFYVAVCRVVNK